MLPFRNFFSLLLLGAFLTLSGLSLPRISSPSPKTAAQSIPLGECLRYTIEWDPPWYLFMLPNMTAGELEMKIDGGHEFKGKRALQIILEARSSGLLARLAGMKIENTYRFYADPDTLCALGAANRIREGKRKRRVEIEYHPEFHRLRFEETDEAVDPPRIIKSVITDNLPSFVRDPFSALYHFRRQPLSAGYVETLVIGHNDRVKQVRAQASRLEPVQTPRGSFQAWKVHTEALMGGLFKGGGEFCIWFSADADKTPLKFEAKAPLGRVRGILFHHTRADQTAGLPPS